MFDRYALSCPECDTKIKDKLDPPVTIECRHCKVNFEVLGNKKTRRAVFVRLDGDRPVVHPLFLPAGSIRALTALLVSLCCWTLLVKGLVVPDYVYSLLLGIIGYYFAYRKGSKAEGTYLYEKREKKVTPLFLPSGVIRSFLIGGFLVVSVLLAHHGTVTPEFARFLFLLWGLIIGYFFAKLAKRFTGGRLTEVINHLKGLMVVIAAVGLFVVLLSKNHMYEDQTLCLAFAATISFYFGSKT